MVYSASPDASSVSVDYRDEDAPQDGSAHYHARLVQEDGQIAWATPIWVDYRNPE